MQKKLIALAIAGLASTGALAQTNVTIYGVADVAYGHATSDVVGASDKTASGLATGILSGSRLGFKATEDLGGGWSAGALYEFGTLTPDGGGAGSAPGASGMGAVRQTYVHLTSTSMGSFQAGRIYTPGHLASVKYDPEGAAFYGPVSRMTTGLGNSIDGGSDRSRQNNSIAWLSPNWKGFTAQVQYGFGESGNAIVGSTDDQNFWGIGVDYSNGPFAIGGVYHNFNDYGTAGTVAGAAEAELTEWFIGASYDFGMVKVLGSYQDFDADNVASATGVIGSTPAKAAGAKVDGDIWSLGVAIPVFKAGTVTLSYADMDRSSRLATGAAKTSADADGWGISYRHNLSKRTTLHIGYTSVDNSTGSVVAAGVGVGAPSAGKDSSGYAMGMRHTF